MTRLCMLAAVVAAVFAPASVSAAPQPETLQSLQVTPAEVTLIGSRAVQQLVVTADADQLSIRDLTRQVEYVSDHPEVAVVRDGVVYPAGDGTATITASRGEVTTSLKVTVRDFMAASPVPFHTEVLAALTKSGCNMGACHGSPSGKGGFRLSLRGYDPPLDLVTLRGEFYGRRANVMQPDESLLLRKPLMEVAHGGGRRLDAGDASHMVLRQWIAEGMQTEPEGTPTLERIELLPHPRVLRDGADEQQLVVNGYFSDGSIRDVTALTAFDSSDEAIATISRTGVVEREGRGEATILARYLDRMSTTQITFLTERPDFRWSEPPVANEIDQLVFRKLQQLQIEPSELCSDTDFLRRASLDLAGRLPTLEETQAFLADQSPQKRAALVDRLLSHDDFARFWSLKWADLLRCNSRKMSPVGVHKFRRWLFENV
ncbi:MAG: DUF1549 domain-containing protein, partial [Planctomycetaceae bacterium]|nr:DUF1549 domain-containing protein [Planctomycetaceae bacterium]